MQILARFIPAVRPSAGDGEGEETGQRRWVGRRGNAGFQGKRADEKTEEKNRVRGRNRGKFEAAE